MDARNFDFSDEAPTPSRACNGYKDLSEELARIFSGLSPLRKLDIHEFGKNQTVVYLMRLNEQGDWVVKRAYYCADTQEVRDVLRGLIEEFTGQLRHLPPMSPTGQPPDDPLQSTLRKFREMDDETRSKLGIAFDVEIEKKDDRYEFVAEAYALDDAWNDLPREKMDALWKIIAKHNPHFPTRVYRSVLVREPEPSFKEIESEDY